MVDCQDEEEPDGVDALPDRAMGTALAHIKVRYQPEFKNALQQACSLVQIAAQRAAAAAERRPHRRSDCRALQRHALHRYPMAEFQSLAGVVVSQLGLSLTRVLQVEVAE